MLGCARKRMAQRGAAPEPVLLDVAAACMPAAFAVAALGPGETLKDRWLKVLMQGG